MLTYRQLDPYEQTLLEIQAEMHLKMSSVQCRPSGFGHNALTHPPLVLNLVNIGLGNGLSPVRRQATT